MCISVRKPPASSPLWGDVLVTRLNLGRRLWPFPGSPMKGDREGYVQIAQSLLGAEAHGARGTADKGLIELSMQ